MIIYIKKIGNFFFTFYLLFSFFNLNCAETKVNLKVFDIEGNRLQCAGVGIPFIIELHVEGNSTDAPKIENLEKYIKNNLGINSTFSNINGKVLIKKIFQYEIRIDKEGEYNFGPVTINNKKNNNFIKVKVEKNEKCEKTIEDKDKFAFVKIITDKDKVYLNQETELKIKFYYKDNVNLLKINLPELKNFNLSKLQNKNTGIEQIGNDEYEFQEFTYFIYPNLPGELIIPSFKAIFEVTGLNKNNFFSFFINQTEQKNILSNSLKIWVMDLPLTKDQINGIGQFKNLKISLNQNEVFKNEGVVLKLEIEGNGNLENAKIHKLNLPSCMKYYDSKSEIINLDEKNKKKIFEFIVQCDKVGQILIPQQKFIFFNPISKAYETLFTKELYLQIKEFKQINNKVSIINKDTEDIKSISTKKLGQSKKFIHINKLFYILFLLPLCVLLFFYFKSLFCKSNFIMNQILFIKSKNRLFLSKKQNKLDDIYNIFINFFSEKFNINATDISKESIIKILQNKKISSELIEDWNYFFECILKLSFCKSDQINESKDFYFEAINWLKLFKKI